MTQEKGYWGSWRQRRVSRRGLVQGVAVGAAGLASAAILGCSEQEQPDSAKPATGAGATRPAGGAAPAAAQPKRGGIVRHRGPVTGGFRAGFDPHVLSGADTSVMSLWYQGLLRLDPNRVQIEPEVAQKWEQPSETEYIFRLAPTVKWHNKPPINGRALTAEDAVFSLKRIRTGEPRYVNRGLLAALDRVEAVDKGSVRVTSKVPDATTLFNLADISMQIITPEMVEKYEKHTSPEHVVGTGAFMLTSHDETNTAAARNPDYWKPGLPYLDGMRILHIRDEQSLWAAFLGGQLEVTPIPGRDAKKAITESGKNYTAEVARGGITTMIWPNLRKKPFDDPRVTRALRLLVDHQEAQAAWMDAWFGTGNSLTLPQVLEEWDLSPDEYKSKLEWKQPKDEAAREAIALLSAAGFTRDNPLKFKQMSQGGSYYQPATELMQQQWRRLSGGAVQSDIDPQETTVATAKAVRGDFEVFGPQGRAAQYDPDQTFMQVYHTKAGNNYGKLSDPRLDQIIDKQRTIFDVQQRKAAVRDVIRYLIDNAPYTNFGSFGFVNAWAKRVKDFTPETGRPHMWQFESVWIDS